MKSHGWDALTQATPIAQVDIDSVESNHHGYIAFHTGWRRNRILKGCKPACEWGDTPDADL
jgi:hypothetical protein